ncbi:MAG: alpha-hydroxy-acid oxidizing protein, partial [Candidatus Diapherotrites archaeon]|nr:alpha-hydroxy-acid oxidizing protein [Candidatus Diapherotrites archaeon]
MSETKKRKLEHLDVCLSKDVEEGDTWLDDAMLVHNSMPECSLEEIDTSTRFLGKKLKAPFVIAAITGGVGEAGKVNKDLARVAEKYGIGFGVGSQRAMLEDPSVADTFCVRDVAPTTFLMGNIGLCSLADYSTKQIESLTADIG